MARKIKGGKRGSRYWGQVSGTTFATQPSGVTISNGGINAGGTALSNTELGYVNNLAQPAIGHGGTTEAYMMEFGVADTAGNALVTGGASNILAITMSTITAIKAIIPTIQDIETGTSTAVTSGVSSVHVEFAGAAATIFAYGYTANALTRVQVDNGVSIAWIAFGT